MTRACVLMTLLTACSWGQTVCRSANFEPPSMGQAALQAEFGKAIVRLHVPDSNESGTGYVIDSDQGFIVTAFHVVQSLPSGGAVEVRISTAGQSASPLKAALVKTLGHSEPDGSVSGPDVALLKVQDAQSLRSTRPVDISLRFPAADTVLYAMGYPQLGDDDNPTLTSQSAPYVTAPRDGSIEVRQAIFGGNSGGPLVDGSGSSIGTCREAKGTGSTIARYVSMADAEELLNVIPLSPRMLALDEQVRGGSITEASLKDVLIKSSTTPTNIELYTWAHRIAMNRNEYTSSTTRKLLGCPLKAFSQRGMDDLVILLAVYADPAVKADAAVHLAENDLNRGQPLSAELHLNQAATIFIANNNSIGATRANSLLARAKLDQGFTAAAAKQSAWVLSHIDNLNNADKADFFSTAATINVNSGQPKKAIDNWDKASDLLLESGQVSRAAFTLTRSADASLTTGKPDKALDSLDKAIILYQKTNNPTAEADVVYKKATVQQETGDTQKAHESLKNYLTLQPDGEHASEAKKILAAPPM